MSTERVQCTFLSRDEDFEKMRYLAKRENRSFSNLIDYLCKLYIRNYEKENGEIQIETLQKL